MKARSVVSKQRSPFFHGKPSIPLIGGKGVESKEAIRRAVGSKSPVAFHKPIKRKIISRATKIVTGVGLGAALMGLISGSVEKSNVRNIANLKSRAEIAESHSVTNYTNRYPKVSPQVASKEMKEVEKLLKLNMTNESDVKMADNVFEIARQSGVSPRVALRTIARSSGKANSLDAKAAMQRERVRDLEAKGEFELANEVNMELQQTEKIQEILRAQDRLDARSKDLLKKRANSVGPFNIKQ